MDKHYSSSLATVLTKLVPNGGVVLDLGPMSSGTTDAFLQKKCRCFVEDLVEYLEDIHKTPIDPITALKAHLLPKDASLKFNVVLCWDLLNYLSLETISFLFESLKPHLQQGTLLHFIKYSGSKIPLAPKKFKLQKDFTFELTSPVCENSIQSYPHSTVKILKHLDLFTIRDTTMNQQGMQKDMMEYLMDYNSQSIKSSAQSIKHSGLVSYFKSDSAQVSCEFSALNSVLDDAEKMSSSVVADLGRSGSNSLVFLEPNCQKLINEDVYSSISWHKKQTNDDQSQISDFILNKAKDTQLDLVLVWDLFSYCSHEQFQLLTELIYKKMQAGALLHMVIHRNKLIPDNPAIFEITSTQKVNVGGNLKCMRDNSLITLTGLMKLLPEFKIKTHSIIRVSDDISYQELLLQYTPNRTY